MSFIRECLRGHSLTMSDITPSGRCRPCRQAQERRRYRRQSQRIRAKNAAYKATAKGQIAQARSHVKQDIDRKVRLIDREERTLQCL